jgi:hypothetical protein
MWVYEIRHDDFRFMCRRDRDARGIDHSDRARGRVGLPLFAASGRADQD